MTTEPALIDRRAALKAKHRQAILDAADSLILERGTARFSVDELAERADIARRTVFNHFASLDEIVMTASSRLLTATVDEFWVATTSWAGDGGRATVFAEFTTALRGMDLPSVISYLWRVLGSDDADVRSHTIIQDVFTRTTKQVSAETARRSTEMDEIESAILVSSLINGIAVIAEFWIVRTGAIVDAESRAVWQELVDTLITSVRTGYAPPG